ncbi:hypothetical protein IJJ05_01615, partial [Candidatus Saccharibacteria bacterium]|nr:hypothetical protein [Candidatus Saccharibacteria bacterium]
MIRIWGFSRKCGFLVGVLVAGLISIFGMVKNADAIGTQTNISTRPDQSASSSASDCYTNSTPGYEWNTGKTCDEGDLITVEAETGSSYYMTFSHNFKTDSAGVSVDCKVTISKPSGDGTKYKLSNAGGGNYSYGLIDDDDDAAKECNATTGSGGAVSDSNRPYTDGKYNYIHRDFLRVDFKKAGKYKFCETITASANGYSANTKSCIKYIITDGGSSQEEGKKLNVEIQDEEGTPIAQKTPAFEYSVSGNSYTVAKSDVDNFTIADLYKPKSDYEFYCWSEETWHKSSSTPNPKRECSSEPGLDSYKVTVDKSPKWIFAIYKKKNSLSFQGKSKVNDTTTDFSDKSLAKLLKINNCSFTDGCEVDFEHYLKKKIEGEGTTSYEIEQVSSYASKITTITTSGSISNSSSGGNGDSPIYTSKIK